MVCNSGKSIKVRTQTFGPYFYATKENPMNEYAKLAIRERINKLEGEKIVLERKTVWYPPKDPAAQNSIRDIDEEIEDLLEALVDAATN